MRGALDFNGNANLRIARGTNTSLSFSLHVDLTNGVDEISGWLSDGAWQAGVFGDRNVFSAISPAAQAGRRSLILQTPDSGTNSVAKGLYTISTMGRTIVTGALKDGRKFNLASSLARTGDFPFYLALSKTEAVIGWLSFPAGPALAASGTVDWVKSGTNAFTVMLQAASAP